MKTFCCRHWRNRRGEMAEFPIALFIFFMFMVFPLLNLLFFAASCATAAFITTQAANSAASQNDYATSLAAMQTTTTNLTSSGWGKFAHLVPNGGYQNCGANLYLVETNIQSSVPTVYGPNTPDPNNPNPHANLYEYRVITNFNIQPFLNLSGVPLINTVPLIGAPAPLSWTVERNVEYPFSGSAAAGS